MRRLLRRLSLCLILASSAGCALVTPLARHAPAVPAAYPHDPAGASVAAAPSLDATAEPTAIAAPTSAGNPSTSLAQKGQPQLPDDGPTPEQNRRAEVVVASLIVLAALIALFAAL